MLLQATINLEEQLDEISNGALNWKEVLQQFWTSFHHATDEAQHLKIQVSGKGRVLLGYG
jgi:DNA topoisomerase IA